MTSFNSGFHVLRCKVEVVSRMLFGVLMILAIAFLLLQRSATAKQIMPVTFIILLLGIMCGFFGKLCVDTLGGSGYHWLIYWETLCMLHFFSNVCTSALFFILHGPIDVSQGTKGNTIFPYWIRRVVFYCTSFLFLPLFCGLTPFASIGEWKHHLLLLVTDLGYWWRKLVSRVLRGSASFFLNKVAFAFQHNLVCTWCQAVVSGPNNSAGIVIVSDVCVIQTKGPFCAIIISGQVKLRECWPGSTSAWCVLSYDLLPADVLWRHILHGWMF